MLRALRIIAGVALVTLALPAVAYASEAVAVPTSWAHIGVSLAGLIISVILLVEALSVRSVALGGAIADKISYVVLAIICLSAAALAQWTGNFVHDVTFGQIQLASQVLVVAAMALFAAYFYSVRSAMHRYLKSMTGSEQLAVQKADDWERDRETAAAMAAQPADTSDGSVRG